MSTMIPVIWILEIDLLKQRVDPTQPPRVNGTVQSQENIPGVSFFFHAVQLFLQETLAE